jgi:hypothetical protein
VPREAWACGTALVLSTDIAARQPDPDALRDRENVFLADPRDPDALAGALRRCLADPEGCRRVGLAGYRQFAAQAEPFDVYATRLAETLISLQRQIATRRTAGPAAERAALCRAHYSGCYRLLGAEIEQYAARFGGRQPPGGFASTLDELLAFGGYLAEVLAANAALRPCAADLARYERALLAAQYHPGSDDTIVVINRPDPPPPAAMPLDARPALSAGVTLADFTYDVAAIAEALQAGTAPPEAQPRECSLAIQQLPGTLTPRVLRLQPLARVALALCDGRRPVREIVPLVEELAGRRDLEATLLRLLDQLAGLRVVRVHANHALARAPVDPDGAARHTEPSRTRVGET